MFTCSLTLLLVGLISVGCAEFEVKPVAVTDVTLNSATLELVEGDTASLIATVSPSNADNKKIIWSSSNASIASVKEGVVTAIKAGTTVITAKSDDGGKTATCAITVVEKVFPVESVSLNKTVVQIEEGDELTLTATIAPVNATNKNIIWTSSDESVAKVNDGKVTALKIGSATITVKTEEGNKTATCAVTVVEKVYHVESVSLDKTNVELQEGEETTLAATVNPANATNKDLTWTSSDESVATIENGKVTALKVGNATITVKSVDGDKTASCEVTVLPVPVESVSLDKNEVELKTGEELTLNVTINPENATNQDVTWASEDESIATVIDGKVTAIEVGTTIITVTTVDGEKTAECKVIVLPWAVESVTLDQTKVEIKPGEEITLSATINPVNATNKNITWTSSDENIATVVDGKVYGVNIGKAIISVVTEDGEKTASCEVNVVPWHVESVALDQTDVEMKKGEEITLTATINPEQASNKNVTWTSSDENVATVIDGKVTAVSAGEAIITVKTEDGEKTAECKVVVIVPVTGVTMEKSEIRMKLGATMTLSAIIQPVDASDKSLSWSVNNPSIVTLTGNVITAINLGTAIVTVTTIDGGFTAEAKITVMSGNVDPSGSDMDVIEEEF